MTKRFGGLWGWLLMAAVGVGVIAALVTGGNGWALVLVPLGVPTHDAVHDGEDATPS